MNNMCVSDSAHVKRQRGELRGRKEEEKKDGRWEIKRKRKENGSVFFRIQSGTEGFPTNCTLVRVLHPIKGISSGRLVHCAY